jgi:hypothetical protein
MSSGNPIPVRFITTSSETSSPDAREGASGASLAEGAAAGVSVAAVFESAPDVSAAELALGVSAGADVADAVSTEPVATADGAVFFGFVTMTTKKSLGLISQFSIVWSSFSTFPE